MQAGDKTEPLVSVCVITYNHAGFIKGCLDSVLAQKTDFPYEICMGEDESSDGTREICEQYALKHPDTIRLFLRQRKDVIFVDDKPTGMFNFIKTLESCRGKYIAICEGDDYWVDAGKLQKQVDALALNPQCALCFCNVIVVNDDGDVMHDGYGFPDKGSSLPVSVIPTPPRVTDIFRLAKGNYIHTPGILFKNWMLNESLPVVMQRSPLGDWPLHMLSARNGSILYQDEVLAAYRVHSGGAWSSVSAFSRQLSTAKAAAILLELDFSSDVKSVLRRSVRRYLRRSWTILKISSDINEGRNRYKRFLREFPAVWSLVLLYLWRCRAEIIRRFFAGGPVMFK